MFHVTNLTPPGSADPIAGRSFNVIACDGFTRDFLAREAGLYKLNAVDPEA
jgi:hypothetical protein